MNRYLARLLPWLCGLSLAANVGLVLWHLRASPPSAATLDLPAPTAADSVQPRAAAQSGSEAPIAYVRADTALANILDQGDLPAIRDALEASGLSLEDAKAVIENRLRENQKPARLAINQRRSPQDEQWWYTDQEARDQFENQRRADRRALDDDLSRNLAALFALDPPTPAPESPHAHAAFLPADKQLIVSRILRDYEALEREGRSRNARGATLPSEEERRRFIEAERRADLIAVLSPEELRAYDLRHSPTADQLRWRLGEMKPTLAEYAAIFDTQSTLDQNFSTNDDLEKPADFWAQRRLAESAALAQLRQTLGEDRFLDYAVGNDHAASQVKHALEQHGLPTSTARDLWKLRQTTGLEGKAIYDDHNLSREEKIARFQALALRSRDTLDRLLDPNGAVRSELKGNNLLNWVERLEKNQITIYSELGNHSSGYGL